MAPSALPTLSEVRAFTGDYLIDAAEHWSDSANRWNEAFDRLGRDVVRPGGSEWTGAAAESAASRISTDGRRVASAADHLSVAVSAARRAADELHAAKTRLLRTVRAAEAAGFEVGQDFSLTTAEAAASAKELASREAQMRSFGMAIRSDVIALVKADEDAAAEIARTREGLRSLKFDQDQAASDRTAIRAVDFHGIPLPEKPPRKPAVPPPEGWSLDPIMRAAQKIAYGHAWDDHGSDFPGMNQSQLADLIHQKMVRALTDPSGLTLGLTQDGAPVIYDPADQVLIIRDSRPNSASTGTVFKPPDHTYVNRKSDSYVSIFSPEQLADGPAIPPPPASSPKAPGESFGPPRDGAATLGPAAKDDGGGGSWGNESTSSGTSLSPSFREGWGTYVPPEELAKQEGALGILGRIILGQNPPEAPNPKYRA